MATFSGWRPALLRAIGAPVTQRNLYILAVWQREEGGTARFNPLNTTESWHGSSNYNSVGVKNYASAADGVAATAKTIKNGSYNSMLRLLRQGNADPHKFGGALLSSPWGTSEWPNAAAPAPKGGGGAPKGGSYYVNPYARSKYLGPDQGTDWDIKGPIGAVGKAKIIRSESFSFKQGTGWIVSYRLLDGPMKGKNIYVAENIKPKVKVGQVVGKGQTIAIAGGSYPYIETGWADSGGHFLAPYGSTATGEDFYNFLQKAPGYRGASRPSVSTPGSRPSRAAQSSTLAYQPHYAQDIAMSGIVPMPGMTPPLDTGPEPASISNMWQSLANLPNASPETLTFAQRASMWSGA